MASDDLAEQVKAARRAEAGGYADKNTKEWLEADAEKKRLAKERYAKKSPQKAPTSKPN